MLRQSGVVRARGLADMLEYARGIPLLSTPAGENVVIITGAGGSGVLLSDACVDNGLRLVEIPPDLDPAFRRHIPPFGAAGNPVVVTGGEPPPTYRATIALDLEDERVHALVLGYWHTIVTPPRMFAELVVDVVGHYRDRGVHKPVVASLPGDVEVGEASEHLYRHGVVAYPYTTEKPVDVLGAKYRWTRSAGLLIGVTLQAVVMPEVARYAMATGESVFFGAARVFKPITWFFSTVAVLVYVWPGHPSAGAAALEELTGVPWTASACVGLVLVGTVFSLAKVVYTLPENLLSVLIGLLVLGTAVVAAMVGTWSDVVSAITGTFHSGHLPPEALTAAWFPVLVGPIAFAGPSGMQQLGYTPHLRDSGAGMGAHIPRIRGLRHVGEEKAMPAHGFVFDTSDPREMAKWKGWRCWVTFDALLLFWGITMLVTVSFTVLAQAAGRQSPDVKALLESGEREAALNACPSRQTANPSGLPTR